MLGYAKRRRRYDSFRTDVKLLLLQQVTFFMLSSFQDELTLATWSTRQLGDDWQPLFSITSNVFLLRIDAIGLGGPCCSLN